MSATATSPCASSRSRASRSLISTTRVVSDGGTGAPRLPRRATTPPSGRDPGERLVDRAVVVVVVDEDLRSARDVAGEPDREPVGVGRRERELPVPQAESSPELVGRDDRVLGRQHVGDPAAELALDGGDRGGGAVAGHRPGVAEAEVDVLVAVDVAEPGAGGLVDEQRERAGPADHPVHRDAVEERSLRPLEQLARSGVGLFEPPGLVAHEAFEPGSVQGPARHRRLRYRRPRCGGRAVEVDDAALLATVGRCRAARAADVSS